MTAAELDEDYLHALTASEPGSNHTRDRRTVELRNALLDDTGLRNIPAPESLVGDWLFTDSLAWLHGKPGHGKSFVAVDLACSVGTGRTWHGHDVTRGAVLYVIAEGARGIAQRVEAWRLAHGELTSGVTFLPVAVQLMGGPDLEAFLTVITELHPALIVVDTQARVTVGTDENSAQDMGRFVDALEKIRAATTACVLVVHHQARAGENMRGSTALEGAAATIVACVKDGPQVTLTVTKQKDAPEPPPQIGALTPVGDSAIWSHEAVRLAGFMTQSELGILAVLRDQFGTKGARSTPLLNASGVAKATFHRSLRALIHKGLVTEQRIGNYPLYLPASMDGQQEVSQVSGGLT